MRTYLDDFSRRIESIVRKKKLRDHDIEWDSILEEIFLDVIPIKQFLTHIELASCKEVDEVISVLSEKDGKPLSESALIKRAQRTVKNVIKTFEAKVEAASV